MEERCLAQRARYTAIFDGLEDTCCMYIEITFREIHKQKEEAAIGHRSNQTRITRRFSVIGVFVWKMHCLF